METKYCSRCKNYLSLDSFRWKNKLKNLRQPFCIECNKAYNKEHYILNKQTYLDKSKAYKEMYKQEIYNWMRQYFVDNPCVDCGETDFIVMHFDHLNDKVYNISKMIHNSMSLDKILVEVAKCESRCANCHMKRTAKQLGWYKVLNL